MYDVTILVREGGIVGQSCTCDDCSDRIPGWKCKHIIGCLLSTRLPYQEPYILISQEGLEKVKSGALTSFTFSRASFMRARPSPKSIWFGVKDGPSSSYAEKEALSWVATQDKIEAAWK
jgi:hypothetical protein